MSLTVWSVPPERLAGELAVAAAAWDVVVTISVVMEAVEVVADPALDVEVALNTDAGNVVNATAIPRPKTSELLLQAHPPVP